MAKRAAPALLATLLVVGTHACAAVFGFDHLADAPGDASTPPLDGAGELPVEAAIPCRSEIGFPAPPASSPNENEPIKYYAARNFTLGIAPTLNLDATCTESLTGPRSCETAGNDQRLVDGPQGQDLAGVGAFSAGDGAALQLGLNGDRLEANNANALTGLIVGVQSWNGAEDSNVTVELLTTRGIAGNGPGGFVDYIGSKTTWVPSPSDRWRPEARSLDEELPTSYATDAWVVNGTLVAHFVTLAARLAISRAYFSVARDPDDEGRPFDIDLYDAWFIAGIDENGLYDARIMGSWSANDLFESVGRILVGPNVVVCTTPALRDFVTREVCGIRDLRVGGGEPGQRCDALSYAYSFTGYRIDALGPVDKKSYLDPCIGIPKIRCEEADLPDAALPVDAATDANAADAADDASLSDAADDASLSDAAD